MPALVSCLCLFLVATTASAAMTGFARTLSHRLGIVDLPGGRKIHTQPIAYLGGLGMAVATLLGLVCLAAINPLPFLAQPALVAGIVVGTALIFLVGLWDDVRGMKPLVKLAFQILIACLLWWAGARIERITVGVEEHLNLRAASLVITVGWYVTLMNSINLIDGLDGLAGGVSFLSALSLAACALVVAPGGEITLAVGLPVVAAGACLGFLFHNWHPARIFMGDGGSLTLGFTLATSSLLASTKAPALLTMLIPLVALGLPIFETAFSFLRRIVQGQSPFRADRRHLHHRLLDLGLSPQRVVMVFLYGTFFLGINSVLLARAPSVMLLGNVAFLGAGLLLLIENLSYLERQRESRVARKPL